MPDRFGYVTLIDDKGDVIPMGGAGGGTTPTPVELPPTLGLMDDIAETNPNAASASMPSLQRGALFYLEALAQQSVMQNQKLDAIIEILTQISANTEVT
jgi:hypothetical protein